MVCVLEYIRYVVPKTISPTNAKWKPGNWWNPVNKYQNHLNSLHISVCECVHVSLCLSVSTCLCVWGCLHLNAKSSLQEKKVVEKKLEKYFWVKVWNIPNSQGEEVQGWVPLSVQRSHCIHLMEPALWGPRHTSFTSATIFHWRNPLE